MLLSDQHVHIHRLCYLRAMLCPHLSESTFSHDVSHLGIKCVVQTENNGKFNDALCFRMSSLTCTDIDQLTKILSLVRSSCEKLLDKISTEEVKFKVFLLLYVLMWVEILVFFQLFL